jgi:transposase
LIEVAKESIGIKNGSLFASDEIILLVKEYKGLKKVINSIEEKVNRIVLEIPGVTNVLEIKGIGINMAGVFAEIGEIKRFSHPKQIIKYAGLNVTENSSGKHKGITVKG